MDESNPWTMIKQRPNFFIVGAMKAGTTSLYRYAADHPQIYMSPLKEPNYFARDISPDNFPDPNHLKTFDYKKYVNGPMRKKVHWSIIEDWESYLKLFRFATDEKVVGEASSTYLYSKTAAENIANTFPSAKILILLRNPVDRAVSHYKMDLAKGGIKETFSTTIKKSSLLGGNRWSNVYVKNSMYYEQVKRYLNCFPKRQVKIYLFEDLKLRLGALLSDFSVFLKIDREGFRPSQGIYNKGIMPRFPSLNYRLRQGRIKNTIRTLFPRWFIEIGKRYYYRSDVQIDVNMQERKSLVELFRPDVERLSDLLQKDLSAWLR